MELFQNAGHPLVKKPCPELQASVLSRLTFSWINALILKGYKKCLELEMLGTVKPNDSSKNLVPRFENKLEKLGT